MIYCIQIFGCTQFDPEVSEESLYLMNDLMSVTFTGREVSFTLCGQ